MSTDKKHLLKELLLKLASQLKDVNPTPTTQWFKYGMSNKQTGGFMTLVASDTPVNLDPKSKDLFPWDTRYLFFYAADEEMSSIHVYFFDKPYDASQCENLFTNSYYGIDEEAQDKLRLHAIDHLILGVRPTNVAGSTFQ